MTMSLEGTTGLQQPTGVPLPKAQGGMGYDSTTPSMVRLNTGNGYGSTNTVIRRWTTVVTNQGTDITYADSATLGATFTINTAGVYTISRTEQFSAASPVGLSLNSTQLTTGINAITVVNILSVGSCNSASSAGHVSWAGYLPAGSVIRGHDIGGNTSGGNVPYEQFTIVRIS